MKKIGIIIVLFILTFSFSVNAEIFMEFDCASHDVTDKTPLACQVNFVYEEVSVEDIDFDFATNLDIEFSSLSGFSLSRSGNHISIHAATPLYDDMLNSEHIAKFTLKANENSKEKESLTFRNIKINKSNEEYVPNVTDNFNVSLDTSLDSNNYLSSITIDKVPISDFSKEKSEYKDIVVNKNIVYIDIVKESEKASVTGLGDVFVRPGTLTEHEIEVTAEDKTVRVYKLFITNNSSGEDDGDTNTIGMELSSDNTLKSLELYNGKEKIPFTFNNQKDTFNVVIENSELEKITIKATTNHGKATFTTGYGPRNVNVSMGENKILVKVKAENNTEKTYTLNITLKESRNSDNTLSSLKINDEVVKLIEDVDTYEVILSKDVEKTKIEAIATNEKAKVEFKDIDLVSGINKVVIKVTAENGDKKEYKIDITRSDKNILKDLKVDGYNLGFSSDQKEYTLKINNDDTKLKIILSPSNIDYEILDNAQLQNGSVVTIKVTDALGVKEYKITILKDAGKLSVVIYAIIILMAIVVAGLIIYMIRKKRKKLEIDVI